MLKNEYGIVLCIKAGESIRRIMAVYHISYTTYKKYEKIYSAIYRPKPSVVKDYKARWNALWDSWQHKEITEDVYREKLEDLSYKYAKVGGEFSLEKLLVLQLAVNKQTYINKPLPRKLKKKKTFVITSRQLKHRKQIQALKEKQNKSKKH